MQIEDRSSDEQGRKEIKVKVPAEYQLKLHKIKVVTGKQISTAVTEALGRYFEELDAEVETPREGEPA